MSAEHYLHHDADTRKLIAEAEVRGAVRERERIARCLRNEAHGRNDAAFNRGVLFAARCALARYDKYDAHSFCADPAICPRCGCHVVGCVEHIDGMHVDFRGDAIVHIGCATCRADHIEAAR